MGLDFLVWAKAALKNKSHTDFHAIGDIGYVECFYQLNGTNI